MKTNLLIGLLFTLSTGAFFAQTPILPLPVQEHLSKQRITIKNSPDGLMHNGLFSEKNTSSTETYIHQPAFKALNLIQIYDSIYNYNWDTTTLLWKISGRMINITYDANNNMTSYLGQSWDGAAWVNSNKIISTYDVNNNETSYSSQYWDGAAWVNSFQYSNTYDANNNKISTLDQNGDGTTWVNSYKTTFIYDTNNNMISYLGKSWDGADWVNFYQAAYTYDANNNNTSTLSQYWDSTAWTNSFKYTYTYDANNNLIIYLTQSWDSSAWADSYKATYTYDSNNNTASFLSLYWDGSAWVNSYSTTYTYDANNNMTGLLEERWNGSAWVNKAQSTVSFDVNNFPEMVTYKFFDISGTVVTYGYREINYFHTVSGINTLIAQDENIAVYPNPTSGKFIISVNNQQLSVNSSQSTINNIAIYNITGEKIYQSTNNLAIDLSSQPNGIYLIQVKTEYGTDSQRIIINR